MKIKNLGQVENALHKIAELDSIIASANQKASDAITLAKAQAEEESRESLAEREKLFDEVRLFSDEHRSEIYPDDKKSLDLVNGTIGYRMNPDSIEVSTETAERLCKLGFEHCVKIKKEPVKAALKGFTDEQLAKVSAKRIPGAETFYAKASEVVVEKRMGAA